MRIGTVAALTHNEHIDWVTVTDHKPNGLVVVQFPSGNTLAVVESMLNVEGLRRGLDTHEQPTRRSLNGL